MGFAEGDGLIRVLLMEVDLDEGFVEGWLIK